MCGDQLHLIFLTPGAGGVRGLDCDPWSETRGEKWASWSVFLFYQPISGLSHDGTESIHLLS